MPDDTTVVEEAPRPKVAGMVRAEWRELGRLGRTALVALVLLAVVLVGLAMSIPPLVTHYLLEAERDSLVRAVQDLTAAGLIPQEADLVDLEALVQDIDTRLPGREIVRVKIWTPDGTVVYSDAGVLIGNTYPLSEAAIAAFRGEAQFSIPDLGHPENVAERGLGDLVEFYVPVDDLTGDHILVYEVYERPGHLLHTVNDIRRYVLVSVTVGVGLLGVLLAILFFQNGVRTMRRQRETERALGDLIRIQDEERTRIVGALHDEIGQPLYRILFGIEDCRARVEPGSPVDAELAGVGALARQVDSRLRSELRLLNAGLGTDLDLATCLRELATVTEGEAGLRVGLETTGDLSLPPVNRAALLRAAQEGIINVRKHACAREVMIKATRSGDTIELEIVDDGVGIDGQRGVGIVTTTERLESIGGGLRVRRRRSGGTVFRAWVPAVGRGTDS
ncbi:MAG TPA: hypothetical protein VGB41_07885 [Acidimicrobiia bacterium]